MFGLHHRSQLNSFNLADDLIEPYRPMVDIVAENLVSASSLLTTNQRHGLVEVLHHACMLDGEKTDIITAIEITVDSLRRAIEQNDCKLLLLPIIIYPEIIEGVSE